ncbi:MAG: 3-deoxy-7-phosphoheptulonate synthase [Planctomycetota bacterium]|jgi:3-deoxy-7-phosphoheptulonate synthase
MIIVMQKNSSKEAIDFVVEKVEKAGLSVNISQGSERAVIGIKGASHSVRREQFSALPGVEEVVRVLKPYKLASLDFQPEPTQIDVKGVVFGAEEVIVSAGPCSIESREGYMAISSAVKAAGAKCLRGGAFKPRSSPYSFQGLGEEGLKILKEASDEYNLPSQTEAINQKSLELVARYADIIQIGARNMQNYDLLKEAGAIGKPVMLKRGMAATVEDLLLSAEYILSEGNNQVILCERGIRTFETATRNTLDISAVPVLKSMTHLPVVIDPSHAAGTTKYITSLSLAAVAAGCDGLLIEVHNNPAEAMSDGEQSLLPEDFTELINRTREVALAIGKKI